MSKLFSPSESALNDQTPLMKQYWELKSQVPDALLFFRMGDFYELFGEDAVVAAQILEITLTSRDKNKVNPVPMAGVPHHSIQGYLQKLLKAGKKIAIGEQMEDPDTVKAGKIVRRKIIRILTPGVHFDAEGSEPNYLAIVIRKNEQACVIACLDASTGETLVSDFIHFSDLTDELNRLPIRHFLYFDGTLEPKQLNMRDSILVEPLPKNYLSQERATETLKQHYDIENLSAFISTDLGILALGILVVYALRTQQQEILAHLRLPEPLHQPKSLLLGPNTAQHLDLADLFQIINQTRSTLGARQLKRWLMAPLRDPSEIADRQSGVKHLAHCLSSTGTGTGIGIGIGIGNKISECLSKVYDLERICGRINTKLATPRDTLALGQSLFLLQEIEQYLAEFSSPPRILLNLCRQISDLSQDLLPLAKKILSIQKEDAPIHYRDGGIFKSGTRPELDRLLSLTEEGQRWLIQLETQERERTGISSLKVRYNRVFGYYIEITQAHLKNVPAHYQRKQTMVGAERFFTEELKKFEEEILTASIRLKALEIELFQELVDEIQKLSGPIMHAAKSLSELDSLLALATLAERQRWCFPIIDHSLTLKIYSGRHPVIDHVKSGDFVPNDILLSPESQLTLLITGPNMGGKSTVMRQTALLIILGQMGAPIPAQQACWGSFSSIFTRIGAQDAITRGQSTFMVEMSELAHILHHSDERSLIILDEIGRGTSTYDGLSVAWSTLEWICTKIKSRTLFATHYHELTRLSHTLPLLANAHMAVEKTSTPLGEKLRFLYELKEGPTHESFGIHVAQIAGLPKWVIQRAWAVLQELENIQTLRTKEGSRPTEPSQLSLFPTSPLTTPKIIKEVRWLDHPALSELRKANINEMTPLQSINFLAKLQELSLESSSKLNLVEHQAY